MAQFELIALDHPEAGKKPISARLRSQLVYFASIPDGDGVPTLGEDEFWFNEAEVSRWVEDGVLYVVSPLDTANMTEVELSEEQEALLGWLQAHKVRHARLIER